MESPADALPPVPRCSSKRVPTWGRTSQAAVPLNASRGEEFSYVSAAAQLEDHAVLPNPQAEETLSDVEKKLRFDEGFERKKTASLLFFGSCLGLMGFVFAFVIGLMKFMHPDMSEYHQIFPSKLGYFPATVSEMVHDPKRPAGKCFWAFASIGATFLFLSWYPWRLRNVYIGDSASVPGTMGAISWPMFRQFVPPTGMMLVAAVTTTPFAQADVLDNICLAIHLTGAFMFFTGYCVAEAVTLGWGPCKMPEVCKRTIDRKQLAQRRQLLTGIVLFYSAFCLLQGLLLLPVNPVFGQSDLWQPRTAYDEFGNDHVKDSLLDTATGFILCLKIASYVSEVMGGLLLILSHLVIWYHCDERKVDLSDELWKVV